MKSYSFFFIIILSFIGTSGISGQDIKLCKAELIDDILTLRNGSVYEQFNWNNGNLIRLAFGKQSDMKTITAPDDKPIFTYAGSQSENSFEGVMKVISQAATTTSGEYLRVEVLNRTGGIEILRVFRLIPLCPAIPCELYFRKTEAYSGDLPSELNNAAIERIKLPDYHWRARSVEFFDVTDRNNNLVQAYERNAYKQEIRLRGNVMLLENSTTGTRLFLLKEAPTSAVQLQYPGYDFTLKLGEVKVVGPGLINSDLKENEWTKAYSTVIGLAETDDELGILKSLREYLMTIRVHRPGRDEMIMLNTWGDMSSDAKISESFALAELEKGAKIKVTHFQLDGGWSAGKIGNSVVDPTGNFNNIWADTNYWKPHPERFPSGLGPVVSKGKNLGIEVCLWFNPDRTKSNMNWERDANALITLNRKYGIRTFKIDGVDLPDKQAEINFRKMLDKVRMATNNEAVFNLDVTAGRRGGYFYFNEYGNIFLENRFTDWHDYFPFSTLRNLWMLSKYVPPQNLQVEFLNNLRNSNRYEGDPFGPANYSFDYVFAISMPAQPLAWFEASGLSDDQIRIGEDVIGKYCKIQNDFHSGVILPVGEEPSGKSWTGFQSVQAGKGYFLVFRENNDYSSSEIRTWLPEGSSVKFTLLIGNGKSFTAKSGRNGFINFKLQEKNSFALYSYSIKK